MEPVKSRPSVDSRRDDEQLLYLIETLHRRNRHLGLERYDDGDVLSHPLYFHIAQEAPSAVRRLLRIPEMLAPLLWREVLGVEKRLIPTALYHLGMTWLVLEKADLAGEVGGNTGSVDYAERALGLRLDSDLSCWGHPYRHHGHQWKRTELDRGPAIPASSCAHHNARLGILFATLAAERDLDRYRRVALDVARALIYYHNWSRYADGTCSVSYYPTTRDEVINTGAEVALLFSALPSEMRSAKMQDYLEGLVRTIIREQNADGSWFYCTARHYQKHGGRKVIDNHHTAMILAALAHLHREPSLSSTLTGRLRAALRAGTRYYLRHLVDSKGRGRAFPDVRREAPLAGYGEGILALGTLNERASEVVGERLASRACERLDRMLGRVIQRFVDDRTGDTATAHFLGKPVHLRSIRLGSGLVLECLARRLWWSRRTILPPWRCPP